jgi:hypothetical protein
MHIGEVARTAIQLAFKSLLTARHLSVGYVQISATVLKARHVSFKGEGDADHITRPVYIRSLCASRPGAKQQQKRNDQPPRKSNRFNRLHVFSPFFVFKHTQQFRH